MAKLSSDGKYVTVEKGDTLWAIASKHLGSGSKYQELAKWNNISNPDLIYIGQKIYLSKTSSSSSSSKKSSNSNQVEIKNFGLQANADNALFVTWNWSKSNTASYLVEWTYDTGNGSWFVSSNTNTVDANNAWTARQSIYTIPSNAKKVRVRIKPISKTYTKNNKETTYWKAEWSSYKTWTDETPLTTPASAPTVQIEKYKLTAKLENINIADAKYIEFQIYKNDGSSAYKTAKATITATNAVSYSCTVDAGGKYKVRCRAVGNSSSKISDWTAFSSEVIAAPAASTGITTIRATSSTSVYLEWAAAGGAETYEIEYATKKSYFDYTDQTQIKSGIEHTKYEFIGLETGQEYFFRVRSVQGSETSGWTEIKSVTIGKEPTAPTTWSSTTTAVSGEDIMLYWVHNSADNSSETKATLEWTVDGAAVWLSVEITKSTDEEKKDEISFVTIDTTNGLIKWTDKDGNAKTHNIGTSLTEGKNITWKVKTAGVTGIYGEYSVQRTINIYAPATLELHVTDADSNDISVLTAFPWYIRAIPGPKSQTPLSYHVTVTANESYVTTDNVGNEKTVSKGDEIYSEYYDVNMHLILQLLPSSIDLENGISYTVTVIVSMDSGLTADATAEFSVSWTDEIYTPNAEISYDPERYVTHIRPYCAEHHTVYYTVDSSDGYAKTETVVDETTINAVYTETGEEVFIGLLPNGTERYYCIVYVDQNGNSIDPVYRLVNHSSGTYVKTTSIIAKSNITNVVTSTGEEVLMGLTDAGDEIFYCVAEESELVEDVSLSVYRREYDGRFVEIGIGLDNLSNTFVTDPHPALDYARYRVVAISNTTGAVSYYDVPGHPIDEHAVIIQWDEKWSTFDTTEESELQQPAWTGSLLRLPYNIDVSDSNNVDVSCIEYIGRQHPVAYYGTQLGTSASWNMDVPSTDKETLYGLRRLMNYMGDVYVREPSGSGYWASIKVSFSQRHRELAIPVSLSITRVEGGV